jgi:hypothetical protein
VEVYVKLPTVFKGIGPAVLEKNGFVLLDSQSDRIHVAGLT